MPQFGGGGTKCSVCSKTAYPAELIMFEQIPFHVNCFRCQEERCGNKIGSPAGAMLYKGDAEDGSDRKIYCKSCFSKGGYAQKQKNVKWTKKETNGSVASKFGGGGNPCVCCSRTVYPAETVSYEGKIYHANCFKCKDCEKKLTPSGAALFEDDLFCQNCFKAGGYTAKQVRAASGSVSTSTSKANSIASRFGGGGTPCTICAKTVYMAETLSYENKVYHQNCFCCSTCDKKMTPANGAQFEEKLFCKKCFAEGGYTQKQAKATSGSGSAKPADNRFARFGGGGLKCKICEKTVYAAENVAYEGFNYHPKCFACKGCGIQVKVNAAEFNKKTETLWCKKCFVQQK